MPEASAPARVALAGNPSDGYHGAVLAITVDMLSARVSTHPEPETRDELTAATRRRFAAAFAVPAAATRALSMSTDIPRSVGLGGSSAIVIAALKLLCAEHHVDLAPDAMAALALSIEVDDLQIAAGLQDRLVQCHGGLVFMDFSTPGAPRTQRLDPAGLAPLLVAWRADHAEASGAIHSDLRQRHAADVPGVRDTMAALAEQARRARDAILHGEPAHLAAAMDATFDLRAQLMDLNPRHVELVTVAREHGAAVNYTGSGGAVVALCQDPAHRGVVGQALAGIGAQSVAL